MLRSRLIRLSVLIASVPVLLLPSTPPATANSSGDPCAGPAVQTFGPASVTGAIVGAAVHEGHAYVVTRGQKPPVVADLDLTTRKVVRTATLPDGPATGEPEGAWATTVSGGAIYLGTYPVPDLYRFDPATGQAEHLLTLGRNGGYIWSLTTAPDGTIYAGTYPDGRVWEYVPSTGAVRNFGVLATGERYVRAVAVDETTVYAGLLDKGKVVAIDRKSGAKRDLVQGAAGIGAIAEHGDRVLAASGTTLLDVRKDGTDLRIIDLGGVTLDSIAVAADGTAYLSSRPNGTILRYRTGEATPVEVATPRLGEETRRLVPEGGKLTGFAGSGGWDLEYDPVTDKLLVATAPLGANLKGALSVVDPDTGEKQVYVDVMPDQSLMSLSVDSARGIVYLGGDVLGGGGTPPTKTSASVGAFDLKTRKLLWQIDPVPGHRTFQDILVQDGLLYGVYKRNASWFALDLDDRAIVRRGPLPGYGELHAHRGRVFTSTYFGGGNVHELSGTEAKLIATGLGDEWYTNPQLAFEPGSWTAWTLVGRELARIRLNPSCPPVTATG